MSINVSQRYSPELQKKALASREQRQKDFDGFVTQLKDLSKSDKPSECGLQTGLLAYINVKPQSGLHRRSTMQRYRLQSSSG
jgi:hypothetical protein